MDIMMPMMSVWISFIVPAAIGVYWIFKSLLGSVKQIIMSKAMPVPTFTEEDYKAAEKEYGGKPEKKKQKGNADPDPGSQPPPHSALTLKESHKRLSRQRQKSSQQKRHRHREQVF